VADTLQSHRDFLNRKYFSSMDGLRCIAIAGVFAFHSRIISDGFFGLRGALGVMLFFIISGFLITTLILRERDQYGFISLRNFYARRSLRIFPLYYGVLTVTICYVVLFERHKPAAHEFFRNIPSFFSYTANWFVDVTQDRRVIFGVAWSLSTEEQFYLFWPSIVSFSRRHRWFPVALVSALGILNIVLVHLLSTGAITLNAPWHNIALTVPVGICFGCLLAYALNDRRMFTRLYPLLSPRWMAVFAIAGMIGLSYIPTVPNLPIYCFMVLGLATTIVQPNHYLAPLLQARPVKYIGAVSYGIYLMHVLILNVGRRILHIESPVLLALFALPVVTMIAGLSYRYFESPFLRYKDRFAKGPRTAEPVMEAPTLLEQMSARIRSDVLTADDDEAAALQG